MEMVSPRPTFQKPSPMTQVHTPEMPKRNSIRLNRDPNNLLQLYEFLLANSFGEKFIKYKYKARREEMKNKTSTQQKRKEQEMPAPRPVKVMPAPRAVKEMPAPRAVKVINYIDDRCTTCVSSPQFYPFQRMEIFHYGRPDTEAPTDLSLPRKENRDQNLSPLRCPICKTSTFYKKEYLDTHMMLHNNKTCDHCRIEFSSLSDLIRHRTEECTTKNQIPSNPVNVSLMKEDKPLSVVPAVEKHTVSHTSKLSNGKRFKCSKCVKQFKFEKCYKTHLVSHNLPGRFECAHCNNRYRNKKSLIMHLKKCHGLS